MRLVPSLTSNVVSTDHRVVERLHPPRCRSTVVEHSSVVRLGVYPQVPRTTSDSNICPNALRSPRAGRGLRAVRPTIGKVAFGRFPKRGRGPAGGAPRRADPRSPSIHSAHPGSPRPCLGIVAFEPPPVSAASVFTVASVATLARKRLQQGHDAVRVVAYPCDAADVCLGHLVEVVAESQRAASAAWSGAILQWWIRSARSRIVRSDPDVEASSPASGRGHGARAMAALQERHRPQTQYREASCPAVPVDIFGRNRRAGQQKPPGSGSSLEFAGCGSKSRVPVATDRSAGARAPQEQTEDRVDRPADVLVHVQQGGAACHLTSGFGLPKARGPSITTAPVYA